MSKVPLDPLPSHTTVEAVGSVVRLLYRRPHPRAFDVIGLEYTRSAALALAHELQAAALSLPEDGAS